MKRPKAPRPLTKQGEPPACLDDPGAGDDRIDAPIHVNPILGSRVHEFFGPGSAVLVDAGGRYPGSYAVPRWVMLLRLGAVTIHEDETDRIDWPAAFVALASDPERLAAFSAAVHLAAGTVKDPPATVSTWTGRLARVAGIAAAEYAHTLAPLAPAPPRGFGAPRMRGAKIDFVAVDEIDHFKP